MTESAGVSATPNGEQLFAVLCRLEARCRDNAPGLPQREALGNYWSGMLFRVGELSLLTPLAEIGEVLNVPREVTPVPATKGWVFGIANNRGTLLPMFDLAGFLLGSPTRRSTKNRVLIVRRDKFPVGLLVSDVSGIRYFDEKPRAETRPELPEALTPFIQGSFVSDAGTYPVFSVRQLTLDPKFNLTGA